MSDDIILDGVIYITTSEASLKEGITQDYAARLCRENKVHGRRVGKNWYVEPEELRNYLSQQREYERLRYKSLAEIRRREYILKKVPSADQAAEASVMPGSILPAQSISYYNPTEGFEKVRELMVDAAADRTAVDKGQVSYAVNESRRSTHRARFLGTTAGVRRAYFWGRSLTVVVVFMVFSGFLVSYTDTVRLSWNYLQRYASTSFATYVGGDMAAVSHDSDFVPSTSDTSVAAQKNIRTSQAAAAGVLAAESPSNQAALIQLPGLTATEVPFSGSRVAYGDIVAFDPITSSFVQTQTSNDPGVYGVVVKDPSILFASDEAGVHVPVARSGSMLVNVTMENGPVFQGDSLTSSSIPGKARRANPGENVFAVATEDFNGENNVLLAGPDGKQIPSGTILVNIAAVGENVNASAPKCISLSCRLLGIINPEVVFGISRYLLAGIIAILSLTFAFKSFMSDANYGVISIGRNPSARSSIRSLVLFNAILAVAVASLGLLAALYILFA